MANQDDNRTIADTELHGHNSPLGTRSPCRREFLTTLAAFGVSTILPGQSLVARASPAGTKPDLIDVHHHFFPPAFLQAALDPYIPMEVRKLVSAWTPQKGLEEMESNGVVTAIASIPTPGTWLGGTQAARSLTRKCNEYSAQLARDYPGRFGFFAALPLPDTEGSLQEIAYALDVLKANGIGLMTSYGDKYPGDPAFAPVLDEINRRKAVVFFHPTQANCCKNPVPGVPVAWAEYPHDTTRAVLSLLASGSLVRLRDIQFIFSHAGGTIPMLAGRIAQVSHFISGFAEKAPLGVEYEFKRLHYDIANSANRSAMAALTNLVPPSQILFGSDYPFVPIGVTAGGMSKVGLSAADLQAIGRDNAIALLPRLKV
jgi:predicted TIM-barrel fold metal-dependent hydrolase